MLVYEVNTDWLIEWYCITKINIKSKEWLNNIFFYSVKLEDPDDDDEVDNCTIVIGLIQKGRRKQKRVGAQNLTIGFAIYKVYFCFDVLI